MRPENLNTFVTRLKTWKNTFSVRRLSWPIWVGLLAIGIGAGCQSTLPPAPTTIPTDITSTLTLTVSLTPSLTGTAAPVIPTSTFRPMATATSPLPHSVTAFIPTATPEPQAAYCIKAQDGDTVVSLLVKGGYGDTSAAPAFRALNNMPPDSNVIVIGQSYCIPPRTPTPTPPGFEKTHAAQIIILPTTGPTAQPITYTVKADDTAGLIEIRTGVALSTICIMNPLPDGLNCAGCDLTAPIFQAKCRPIVHAGQVLKIPGPTPTPTLTPTLSGNETATPTLAYGVPQILNPQNNSTIPAGSKVRLEWISVGELHPDQTGKTYLILVTMTGASGDTRNLQRTSSSNDYVLTDADLSGMSGTYTFYWQVSVAHKEKDGSLTIISPKSNPASFTLTR